METRLSGNAFQILAAATGKARLQTVECLKGGTTRRLVPEERSERRPSVTRLSGPRYRGATPQRTLWVSTAILNSTRSGTRSQWMPHFGGGLSFSIFQELFQMSFKQHSRYFSMRVMYHNTHDTCTQHCD